MCVCVRDHSLHHGPLGGAAEQASGVREVAQVQRVRLTCTHTYMKH
jgi:hypothetical protein